MPDNDIRVLKASCIDSQAWQVRHYAPDPAKVMILCPIGRWVFDAAELVLAIKSVASVTEATHAG